MADIDRLDIIISAEASKAEKQINKLQESLKKLSGVLGGLNTSGLSNLSDGVEKLGSAMKSISGVQTKEFSRLANNLTKLFEASKGVNSVNTTGFLGLANSIRTLGGVDAKSIDSISGILGKLSKFEAGNIEQVSNGLGKAVLSIGALSEISFNNNDLRNIINSITRLLKVDTNKFNPEQFRSVISVIKSIGNIPDTSKSINQMISSLAKLLNAGKNSILTANSLPSVVSSLKSAVNDISKIPDISASVNSLVSSIARLASSGKKTGDTADGLEKLAKETLKFFEVMQNAPRISSNTLRMTEALSRLASVGNKLGGATSQVTNVFNKISGLSKKAETQIRKAAKSIVSSFKNIGSASSSLRIASINLSTLLSGAVLLRGVREFTNFSKSALGLGSDITEVENVVDVSFGNMASKAYDFSKAATSQFGLSELAAKKYSGTMMAMLKSSGVAQSAASSMSTILAGLAGDFASFYNITTDEAFTKIRSGISGETEPLKQLGINMSVANLEAYALSHGIKTAYSSMSQAEKTILRYNYLISVTGDQQGDFARTAGTWANQVRLLQLNFQSLKAVVGQGLISAILPGVKLLNTLMAKLTQVAETFRRFMYTLSGKKLEGSQSGVVNDLAGLDDVSTGLDGVADSGNDSADGLDSASDAAKRLQDSLNELSFDEINKLNDATNNLANASSGIVGGDISALSVPSFDGLDDAINSLKDSKVPEEISKWAKRIREAFLGEDWKELGAVIADGLNRGLQKVYDVIDWKNVGPKITEFTDAFTRTFNSLTDNLDWDLLGRTIGTGINTIAKTLNQLIDGIDWKNLGFKFAVGVNGIAGEVDWYSFGNLLGGKFMIAWNMLYGFIGGLDYGKLGRNFAQLLNGAFKKISFSDISITLTNFINGGFSSLTSFTNTFSWDDLADNVTSGLNAAFKNMKWEEAGESLEAFLDQMNGFMLQIASGADWEEFGEGIGKLLDKIDWIEHLINLKETLKQIFTGIWIGLGKTSTGKFVETIIAFKAFTKLMPFVNGLSEFFTGETVGQVLTNAFKKMLGNSMSNASSEVSEKLEELEQSVSKSGLSAEKSGGLFNGFWSNALNIGASTALVEVFTHGRNAMDEMNTAADDLTSSFGPVSQALSDLADQGIITNDQMRDMLPTLEDAKLGTFDFDKSFQNVITTLENAGISSDSFKTALSKAMQESSVVSSEYTQKINEYLGNTEQSLDDLKSTSGNTFPSIDKDVATAYGNVESTSNTTWLGSQKSVRDALKNMKSDTSTGMQQVFKNVESYMTSIYNIITNKFRWAGDRVNTLLGDMSEDVGGGLRGMNIDVQQAMNQIANSFTNLGYKIQNSLGSLYDVGRNAAQSFSNGFRSVYIPTPHINVMGYNRYQMGNSILSTPNFGVQWYSSGGFPNAGELFMARESGPELIGRMGRKNAVANNNQIVDGIKVGVYEAVRDAITSTASSAQGNKANVTVVLEGDAKGLFKVVKTEGEKYQKSTGKPVFA